MRIWRERGATFFYFSHFKLLLLRHGVQSFCIVHARLTVTFILNSGFFDISAILQSRDIKTRKSNFGSTPRLLEDKSVNVTRDVIIRIPNVFCPKKNSS